MYAARLLAVLQPSCLRYSQSAHPVFSMSIPSIRFKCYTSAASALDSTITQQDSSAAAVHPWPEWVNLVDRLKTKGYLTSKGNLVDESPSFDGGDTVYTDIKLVKDACLSFARDRSDIIRSLSKNDIQNVVGKGCPNLLRKAVNSAKRLRAYLALEEGYVCNSCDLRDSCDRANVILDESEASARTVDIVRILLVYALDPVTMSEDGETKSPGRKLIQLSVRKLLSQLIVLDEVPPDPDLPKVDPMASRKKNPSQSHASLSNGRPEDDRYGEIKRGDWRCEGCNFINFARNLRCLKCKMDGPERVGSIVSIVHRKKGDWDCPQCSMMNYAGNRLCIRCKEPRPQRQLKPGDWECPSCDFVNFSRNSVCKKCNLDRPWDLGRQMQTEQRKPGDWECPSCDFVNFSRNGVCKNCNLDRPSDAGIQMQVDQQHAWKKPSDESVVF